MVWLNRLKRAWRALTERSGLEDDLDEELRLHLELEIEENLRRGLGPDEAQRRARAAFGAVDAAKEGCRDSWGTRQIETLSQDVRIGLRGLRRNPAYTAIAVLTLGLGIGANTAIFSVVHGVLLKPLPYSNGERLVHLSQHAQADAESDLGVSFLELADYRQRAHSLDALVEYHSMTFTLLGGDEPLRVRTGVVSADFFDVLGVTPLAGRGFREGEDVEGAEPVLLLGHGFWRERFGADPGVVGRRFEMNDRIHTVVGVLPPLPGYPDENDVYMPASSCPFRTRPLVLENRSIRMLRAMGRLKPGVTLEQAGSEIASIAASFPGEHPDAYADMGAYSARLTPVSEEITRHARPTFLLLLGTVALILLLACANVANLALARLASRSHEIAVRTALGAGRGRLARQLVTESTLLALAGGTLGLGLAAAGLPLLEAFAAQFSPRAFDVAIDAPVLVFTLVVSVVTGLVFGSLPGLPAGDEIRDVLHERTRGTRLRTRRIDMRRGLVVAQLAISFVVLTAAALMLRSLVELQRVDPGFRTDSVLSARLDVNWSRYAQPRGGGDGERLMAFYEPLLAEVRSLPGVRSASLSWTFPLNDTWRANGSFLIEGAESGSNPPRADFRSVSPEYFETLGIPLVAGRAFDARDTGEGDMPVIVSASLARRHWGDPGSAVGRRVSRDGAAWSRVVGVAGDVRQYRLDEPPGDVVYLPFARSPGLATTVLVRSGRDVGSLAREVRAAVVGLDPETAFTQVRSLDEVREAALASPRLVATLLGLFAALALSISAAGVGGVLAYTVSRRSHEIGVRLALGADPSSVVAMIVGQGLGSALRGLALGTLGALAAGRLMSGLLFGVEPTDPACFVGSALVFLLVSAVASFVPAWRATSIQPLAALRAN